MILTFKRIKLRDRASSQIVALLQSFPTVIKILSFDSDKAVWHWLEASFFFMIWVVWWWFFFPLTYMQVKKQICIENVKFKNARTYVSSKLLCRSMYVFKNAKLCFILEICFFMFQKCFFQNFGKTGRKMSYFWKIL